MAVYTSVTNNDLENLLKNYNIGVLKNYEGIEEGVENSNFKILTEDGIYILTIFEKRVSEKDLPFFINLMNHLSTKGYKCPKPVANRNGTYIEQLKGKPCTIVSFIKGGWVKKINSEHCKQLGYQLAKLHIATEDFAHVRTNDMGQKNWQNLYNHFKSKKIQEYSDIYDVIEKEIPLLEKQWPKKLPSGVIHADLFQDNVFFENGVFSGVIDFYFSCNDFYAYELAVTLNAWCFERDQSFNTTKARLILNAYKNERPLSKMERDFFPVLSRGAALRFLLTRLNDVIFHPGDAFVKPKDPREYLRILNFHQKISSIDEYGLEN